MRNPAVVHVTFGQTVKNRNYTHDSLRQVSLPGARR
jgi:hypothetical protein